MTGEKSGEFRGKTIETAISAGLVALRLAREEVEVEIVKPGSRGVLGIGAEDALVRLTAIRPGRPEPKLPARPEPLPVAKLQQPEAPAQSPVVTGKPEPRQEPSRPEPTSRSQTQPAARPEAPRPGRPASAAADDKELAAAQQGQEFLTGLLERMGLRAAVEIVAQSDAEADEDGSKVPVLNIVGDDLEVLIGRQNETFSALEFITRLMVNQQSHTRSAFVVDVNGYRARRAESLRKLAFRTAEQVMQTNRTMALEPMSPAERRIIHLALRDHAKVYTQSVGEGDRRKVTVIPKKD
ncbi:MAG: Jag N-terminal domain-containing protein [Chloroflexi bacterium]|nr:Jag N-terminal domain-containing protein [Chloroflexota bacterium]